MRYGLIDNDRLHKRTIDNNTLALMYYEPMKNNPLTIMSIF